MQERILSIGTIYLDINAINFPHGGNIPAENELVGNQYETVPGGSAFNFARVCKALGLEPAFIGKVGDDEPGKILQAIIQESGVHPYLIIDELVQTNIGINLTNDTGKTVMAVVGSANKSLEPEEISEQVTHLIQEGKTDTLYLGGVLKFPHLIPTYIELVRLAKNKNIQTVLDHGRVPDATTAEEKKLLQQLATEVTYYLPSEDELLTVWHASSLEEAVTTIRETSDVIAVVKLAQKGCAVSVPHKQVQIVPAFKVEVQNPVGAGDSFNAGFIKALSDGQEIAEAAQFANATAALKISSQELPTEEKVKIFLHEHSSNHI